MRFDEKMIRRRVELVFKDEVLADGAEPDGRPSVSESEWNNARKKGWIRAAIEDAEDLGIDEAIADLLKQMRRARSATAARPAPVPRRVLGSDRRSTAAAGVFAIEASAREEIKNFRKKRLGRLLELEEVAGWVRKQVDRQGAPTLYCTYALDAHKRPIERMAGLPGTAVSDLAAPHILQYSDSSSPSGIGRASVRAEHALGWLKQIARDLTSHYRWTEPEAVDFVLCEAAPRITILEITRLYKPAEPALDRLLLEVDPNVSPPELKRYYAEARERYLRKRRGTERIKGKVPRVRPIEEMCATLAIFIAEFIAKADDPQLWKEAMAAWNEKHKSEGERFEDETRFRSDCHEAYELVTGRKLAWLNPQGRPPATSSAAGPRRSPTRRPAPAHSQFD